MCDVCGRETGAEHYAILLPGGVCWEVDLCKEHSKPLLEFRKKGIGHEKAARRTRKGFTKTSIEEVQRAAQKRA